MIKHPLYPNGSIYLSGGMQFAKDLGAGWRIECSKKLRELQFYPIDITMLDQAYAKDHGHLYEQANFDFFQYKSHLRKQFIETDINLLKNDADAVIVYYDESVRRGAGTTCEVHEAFRYGTPVFAVNAYKDLKEMPGWMKAETTEIFEEWDELYSYLECLPPAILKRDMYGNRRSGNFYLCSLCGKVEEKHKSHFVSEIKPLYCKSCVEIAKETFEKRKDRYEYFLEYFEREMEQEMNLIKKINEIRSN